MSSSCLPRTVIFETGDIQQPLIVETGDIQQPLIVETGEIQQPLIVESGLDSFVSISLAPKTKT